MSSLILYRHVSIYVISNSYRGVWTGYFQSYDTFLYVSCDTYTDAGIKWKPWTLCYGIFKEWMYKCGEYNIPIRRKYIHFNLYQFWWYVFQSRVYTLSSVSFYDMAHIIEQEIIFYCKNIKLRQRIRMTIFTKHKMIFICILQNTCHTESKVFIFIAYLKVYALKIMNV